jgi:hypothetical protein
MATTPTSTGYAIARDLQTILRSVTFVSTADNRTIASERILIRKLPVSSELEGRMPAICIARYGKVESRSLDFEGDFERVYQFEVCIIEAAEGDYETDEAIHETWHEQMILAIQEDGDNARVSLPNVPTAWKIEVDGAPTVDRSKLYEGYSYQSAIVKVTTAE